MGELTAALNHFAVATIVLASGTYEFDASTACDSYSWLCINRAVTIQAAEVGMVVLDAKGQRRVFGIIGTGVELVGLNITGGSAGNVRRSCFELAFRTFWPFFSAPRWNVTHVLAFCMQYGSVLAFLNRA